MQSGSGQHNRRLLQNRGVRFVTTVVTCNCRSRAALVQPKNKGFQQHLTCRNPLFSAVFLIFCSFPLYQLSGLHFYENGRVGKAVFWDLAERDIFLIGDGIAIALVGALLRKDFQMPSCTAYASASQLRIVLTGNSRTSATSS